MTATSWPGGAPVVGSGRRVRLRTPLALSGVLGVVVAVVLVGLALSGDATATGRSAGLSDAGGLTQWLLPVSRAVFDLAAVGCTGVLVVLAWLVPADEAGLPARLRRAATGWAALWATAALLHLLVSVSQVVGVPIARLLGAPDLLAYGVDLPQGRALLTVAVGALAIALWVGTTRTAAAYRAWAVLAPALLVPLLATGHAATASHHFLATETLLVHVVAASVWVGGLLALVVHLRGARPAVLSVAVGRFSSLALACFVVVALSGLVGAWTRIGLDPDVWASTYGVLLVAKGGVLVAIAATARQHRRRGMRALAAGAPRAFLRWATVEVGLMATAFGLAVVLARTSPPIAASLQAAPPHAARFPTVDATLPALSTVSALTATRPDPLVVTLLLALAAVGGRAVVRRSARPGRVRPLLLGAGLVVVAWSLVGGVGAYSTSLLSAQVVQLVLLGLVAPMLVARSGALDVVDLGPVTARAARVGRGDAVLAMTAWVALTLQTPLLATSLHSSAGHLALALVTLALGLLVCRPGAGPVPVGRLALLAAVLAWYGVRMRGSGAPYAGGWYDQLDLWWGDAAADQRVAGVVLLVAAVVVALGAVLSQGATARRSAREVAVSG